MNFRDRGAFRRAFSLVEVVLALGVISFAIIAILGVFPMGLQTSHSAQDETRAAQIAQGVFAGIAAQAPLQFSNVQFPVNGGPLTLNLSGSTTPTTPQLYADNNGQLSTTSVGAIYAITIATNSSPAGSDPADSGLANQVTIFVDWPAAAPKANQTRLSFVQIISKY